MSRIRRRQKKNALAKEFACGKNSLKYQQWNTRATSHFFHFFFFFFEFLFFYALFVFFFISPHNHAICYENYMSWTTKTKREKKIATKQHSTEVIFKITIQRKSTETYIRTIYTYIHPYVHSFMQNSAKNSECRWNGKTKQ